MKDGYYWVKFMDRWEIGLYDDGDAESISIDGDCIDILDVEIGDYIETPDKYKDGK